MPARFDYFSGPSPQAEDQLPAKHKGGRKPKYTDEGRKQRNRDAQAAFRERRTDYIKELEEKVKLYSDKLRTMETTKSNTATECLMLRYKNSLLERILVHNGIDVNAELNTALWKPPTCPEPTPPSPTVDRRRSLKRKSKYDITPTITSPVQEPPLSQRPASSSSDTSTSPPQTEITTPPSIIEPPPKRSKMTISAISNTLQHPGRRGEAPTFSPPDGNTTFGAINAQKPHAATGTPNPLVGNNFLDIDFDLYDMLNPAIDEFNLGLEFPILPVGVDM